MGRSGCCLPPLPGFVRSIGFRERGEPARAGRQDPLVSKLHPQGLTGGGFETTKSCTLPIACNVWMSDDRTDHEIVVLCYASYYESGSKNQFKCLLPFDDTFKWVTYTARRMFRDF